MNDFGMQDVYTLQIKRHRRSSDLVSPNCEACQKGFLHVNSLQVREFTQTGKLPGVCKSCNTQFLKICRIQIRNMSQAEQHSHVCDLCGKSFTHAGNFMKHKRMHEIVDGEADTSITDLATSADTAADGAATDSAEGANTEGAEGAKTEGAEGAKTEGTEGAKTGGAEGAKAEGTGRSPVLSIANTSKPNPPHSCKICGKMFMKYGSYLNHLEGHNIGEELVCPICERTCSTKATFKTHVDRCKSRQAVYVCQYCENMFNTKSSLKTHLDTHAVTMEENVCKFCKEAFHVAEELEQHLLQHLNEHTVKEENPGDEKEKFNHFCVECHKGFVHLGTLRNHMQTHVGKLPYECKTCKKQFVHSGRLKKHMKLHIKKWPYTCPICAKRFINPKTYKKHRASHKQ